MSDSDINSALGNVEDWYDNGAYIKQPVCPHYNSADKSCNVFMLDNPSSAGCSRQRGTLNWRNCRRALAALDLVKQQDTAQVEVPVIGTASVKQSIKNPAAGYRRDIYIDEIISDALAQSIADTIASNILAVKGIKGIRKTVTVPYDTSFQPDGTILEVSHDWENLQTSITYKDNGDIPDFLISQSVAGIAAFVFARDSARLCIPKYGVVASAESGYVSVQVGGEQVSCTTKLNGLAEGDIVLVAFLHQQKMASA